jgi:hypothetical protein
MHSFLSHNDLPNFNGHTISQMYLYVITQVFPAINVKMYMSQISKYMKKKSLLWTNL